MAASDGEVSGIELSERQVADASATERLRLLGGCLSGERFTTDASLTGYWICSALDHGATRCHYLQRV